MAILSAGVISFRTLSTIFLTSMVMDQNMKRIVSELLNAERRLIQIAAFSPSVKNVKRRPRTIKSGAPGG